MVSLGQKKKKTLTYCRKDVSLFLQPDKYSNNRIHTSFMPDFEDQGLLWVQKQFFWEPIKTDNHYRLTVYESSLVWNKIRRHTHLPTLFYFILQPPFYDILLSSQSTLGDGSSERWSNLLGLLMGWLPPNPTVSPRSTSVSLRTAGSFSVCTGSFTG